MPLGSNAPSPSTSSHEPQDAHLQPLQQRLLPAILSRKRKADQLTLSDLQRYYPVSETATNAMGDSDTDNEIELGAMEEFSLSSSSSCSSPCSNYDVVDEQENSPPARVGNRVLCLNNPKQTSNIRQPLTTLSNASSNGAGVQKRVLGVSQVNNGGNNRQQAPGAKRLRLRSEWAQFRECQPKSASIASASSDPRDSSECPLPELRWADREEVWQLIRAKERAQPYLKPVEVGWLQRQHPCVTPKMRSVLLDWLSEVCDVHRMHRETFYLATDFFDRVMAASQSEPKNRLQLIGVTCLFVASKVEEIYPPKVADFAYVTDGACTEDEILSMELLVLKKLRWALSPVTANSWLKLYMQILAVHRDSCEDFLATTSAASSSATSPPASFSGLHFSRVMQLLDLCHLDVGVLSHSASVLAAAALAHFDGTQKAVYVSKYPWRDLAVCYAWMDPFAKVVKSRQQGQDCSLHKSGKHEIQTHAVDLSTLEEALKLMHQLSPVSSSSHMLSLSISSDNLEMQTTPDNQGNKTHHVSCDSGVFMTPQTPDQQQLQQQQQQRRSRQRRL